MSDPLINVSDLGTYLNDPNIDPTRAAALIADAQTLCESVLSPLPAAAAVIVKRVAGRAYVTITSPRQQQLAAGGSPFAAPSGGSGGVWLSRSDKQDLRRLAGGGGAFTIDVMPATAGSNLPWWDQGGSDIGWQGWSQ